MLTISGTSLKISTNKSFWLPIITFLAYLNSSTQALSFIFIAGYALLGKEEAIQSLVLTWFFTSINPILSPDLAYQVLFKYLVVFSAFISIFLRTNLLRFDKLYLYSMLLGIYFILHSIFFSQYKDISILKIINWMIIMITLLKAWSGLNVLEHERMQRWIIRLLLLIAEIGVELC